MYRSIMYILLEKKKCSYIINSGYTLYFTMKNIGNLFI